MKNMRRVITAIIKRTLFYLVLGFVMSWVVASALALMPHAIGPGRFSYSQQSTAMPRSPKAITYFLYDSRWIGVWEQQYSTQRRTPPPRRLGVAGPPMQLWWAWEPVKPVGSTTLTFLDLRETFRGLETTQDSEQDSETPAQTDMLSFAEIKYGWPALSHRVRGAYNESVSNIDNSFKSKAHGGVGLPITKPGAMSGSIAFPYQPIWTGLIINTLFWSIIIATLLSIKRAFRHARRMRKGQCPLCSYDLEYVSVNGCPECGWRKNCAPLN
tara:strand:- start:232043 stop:232852 length:810 start_codon:yes stop_codon:yes gene_type:complete